MNQDGGEEGETSSFLLCKLEKSDFGGVGISVVRYAYCIEVLCCDAYAMDNIGARI